MKTLKILLIEDDMKEFLRSFYFILNVAVGGNWPGEPDGTTVFPQTMYTDYIRVYSKNEFQAPAAPALDIEVAFELWEKSIEMGRLKDFNNQ